MRRTWRQSERGANLSETVYMAACNERPDFMNLFVDAVADVNGQDELGNRHLCCVVGTALPDEEGALTHLRQFVG